MHCVEPIPTASSTLSVDGVVAAGVVAAGIVAAGAGVVSTGVVVDRIATFGFAEVDEFSVPQPFKTTAKQMMESMRRIENPFMWRLKTISATVTAF